MMIDKLYENVKNKSCVCVGLDTDLSYIPQSFADKYEKLEDKIFEFNKRIIDKTADVAGCFKVQIAYYESMGLKGLVAYKRTLEYIKEVDQISIADIKRGDIAKTAEMYAKAHFEGDFEADFITLAPYMGLDSITPYLPYAKEKGKGMFVLVRTSNEGAHDFEYLKTENGNHLYDVVGDAVQNIGSDYMGECGYSAVGAVIGGTHTEEAIEIRERLDKTFFLIPGYGAQGGKACDIAKYLKDGNGGVVNSSRAVLLAYKKAEDPEHFDDCARAEVLRMKKEIEDEIEQQKI